MGELTRLSSVEPTKAFIAMSAGARPAVRRHLRRASENGPTHVLSLPIAGVALDAASSRLGNGPIAPTGEDVLLRLAPWLADVAAEAALTATAVAPRLQGKADDPPVGESAP